MKNVFDIDLRIKQLRKERELVRRLQLRLLRENKVRESERLDSKVLTLNKAIEDAEIELEVSAPTNPPLYPSR